MAIVGSASIRITPDLSGFGAQLSRDLKAATAGLDAKIKVDVDTGAARAELAALRREVNQLARDRANVRVDVDGAARAKEELAGVEREARKLNGQSINIGTGSSVGNIRGLHVALAALTPTIIQVTAALSPLVGLLGAIPGGIVGVSQSVGALGMAFHGIGGAIKEAIQGQDAAAKSSLATSNGIARSVSQVKNAQASLAQAQRSLANVRRDNAAGAAADARAIVDAQRGLADAHRAASRQQTDDLAAIADAQKGAKRAQMDLNEARRQAIQDLHDLNDASRSAALDTREAETALQRQQAANAAIQADPTKSAEEKQRSQEDLAAATARVEEAEHKEKDAANEAEDARKKGIEGADAVIKAKQDLADAEERITQAQDDQARHRADSARAINEAERRVEDARRQRHQNALDRADALKNAQDNVAQAQRGVTDAHKANTKALQGMSAAAIAAKVAYDKLTPAGKDFVDAFLKFREVAGKVGDAVAEATLPGFTKFIEDATEVLPDFTDVLADTGDAFGDFAGAVGDLLKGPFGDQLHRVMHDNVGVLRDMLGVDNGGGLLGLFKAMGNIADAARPMTRWIGELANRFGLWADNQTKGEKGRERLHDFFDKTMDVAKTFGGILKNVFDIIGNIGKAAFPSGTGLLKSLDTVTEKFAKWTGSKEGQKKMKDFFDDIRKIFETVAGTIGKIVEKVAPLIAKLADFLAKHPKLVQLLTTAAVTKVALGAVPGGGLVGDLAGGALGGLGRGGAAGAAGGAGLIGRAAPLVANPVGATVAAGLLAVGASYVLSPDAKKIMDAGFKDALDDVSGSFDNLKESFGRFWDKYGDDLTKFGNMLAKWIGTQFVTGIETLADALGLLGDSIAFVLDSLTGDTDAAKQDLDNMLDGLWDLVSGSLPGQVITGLVTLVKDTWRAIVKWWDDTAKPWFKALPGNIWGWIQDRWHDLTDPIGRAWTALWTWIQEKFDDLKNWFRSRPSAIATWFGERWSDLSDWLGRKWDDLKQNVRDKWNGMQAFFAGLPGKFFGWIQDSWKKNISDPLATLFSNLVDRIGDVWDGIKNRFVTPVNWVIDNVINPLINKVNGVIDKLGGDANTIKLVGRLDTAASSGSTRNKSAENNNERRLSAAGGAVLPGFTPGRDVHHFYSPTGGLLHLSGGEAIMRPEFTALMGGEQGIARINAAVQRPRPSRWAATGTVWPVPGHDTGTYAGHDGVDINRGSGWDDYGDPIRAFRSGTISYVGSGRGYGDAIFEVGSGFPEVVYGHTSARLVRTGQHVSAGDLIGRVGNTGRASAPHLHFGHPGGTYAQAMALLQGAISGGSTFTGVEDRGMGLGFNPLSLLTRGLDAIKNRIAPHVPGGEVFQKIAEGVFGTLKNAAVDFVQDKAKSALSSLTSLPGRGLSAIGGLFSGDGGSTQQLARQALSAYGWGNQWSALNQLVSHESSWNPRAENPTTTASGLFQFIDSTARSYGLPGHASSSPVNAQIAAGLRYIRSAYGDPNGAWRFWQGHHWYANGGLVPGSGVGDVVPLMATPGEYVMRKQVVDRLGAGTFDQINRAGNNLPFRLPGDEDRLDHRIESLIAAVAGQPRAVYGAEHVHVDTAADFQRLQQLADWRERGTKVA
jgi:murein DD-endopeptidase MepM/ murein hydrolase activator NlpD